MRSADQAADDDEPAGDAHADGESLERGLARCDGDRRGFVWREAGDRRTIEGQLLGLCDGCVPGWGERLSGKLVIERRALEVSAGGDRTGLQR
jgi:hypothetical protein